jgi:hypothetical protein
VLLRNPVVVARPLAAARAAAICQGFRSHPRWQVLGFPQNSRELHDAFWPRLAQPAMARRLAYDWRMGLSLVRQGVDEFATAKPRDFQGIGFKRVWNPLLRKGDERAT